MRCYYLLVCAASKKKKEKQKKKIVFEDVAFNARLYVANRLIHFCKNCMSNRVLKFLPMLIYLRISEKRGTLLD